MTHDVLEGWTRDGDWVVSPRLDAPGGATRVGVLLRLVEEGAMPALEARAIENGRPVGSWRALAATWSEVDHHVAIAELGELGHAAEIRIAASAIDSVDQLRWNAVVPEAVVESSDELGTSSDGLRSELSGLGIITRAAWGRAGDAVQLAEQSQDADRGSPYRYSVAGPGAATSRDSALPHGFARLVRCRLPLSDRRRRADLRGASASPPRNPRRWAEHRKHRRELHRLLQLERMPFGMGPEEPSRGDDRSRRTPHRRARPPLLHPLQSHEHQRTPRAFRREHLVSWKLLV